MSEAPDKTKSSESPIEAANRELREEQLPRLRTRDVAQSFLHDVLDLDLPILRTVVDLTIRPGKLCRDYINGYRRRYSNPLRYAFLTSAMLALVYALIGVSPTAAIDNAMGMRPVQSTITVSTDDASDGAAAPTGEESTAHEPGRQAVMQREVEAYTEWMRERMNENFNYVAFMMLPMIALVLRLFFRREQLNYAEHFAFVLFVWGQGFLFSTAAAITGFNYTMAGFVATMLLTVSYQIWAAVQFYAESALLTILKMIAVTIVQSLLSGLVGMVIAVVMLLIHLRFVMG